MYLLHNGGGSMELIKISEKEVMKKNKLRMIGLFTGLAIAGLGLLMMISIILIIPGVFGVLVGLVISVMSIPKANVECPNCEYDNKVELKKASKECDRCKRNLPIEWTK